MITTESSDEPLTTKEKQLNKVMAQMQSLKQSVALLQQELNNEQQKSALLESRLSAEIRKFATLEERVITEQQKYATVETRLATVETRLATEEQKSATLERRCEYLETLLAAEKQKSQSLEEKCNNQEERLRTVEDAVERLWTISRDEITLSNKILGTGGWGYVKEVTFRGRCVAAKCLHETIISPHNQELFAKEMKISA